MLPHVRRFLEDHNITDIDQKFDRCWDQGSEWTNYVFVAELIDDKYSIPFFEKLNTAASVRVCGWICVKRGNYDDAIKYYKLSCGMENPYMHAYFYIAECYAKLGDADEYLKYMKLSIKSGYHHSGRVLGSSYEYYDLRRSRFYFKKCNYPNDQTRVEHKIMDRFNILTDKKDYVLVYKLMVKYNKPEAPRLRQLIEKEYCELGGLIKVLSDIMVSYLIPNNKTRKNKNAKRQKLL